MLLPQVAQAVAQMVVARQVVQVYFLALQV
jgi:hypothetical protein